MVFEIIGTLLTPIVQPMYASFRGTTIEQEIVVPATSMTGQINADTIGWICEGCREGKDLDSLKISPVPDKLTNGTWVTIANPNPQPFRHQNVLLVHRQRNENVDEGFEERIYVVPAARVERRTRTVVRDDNAKPTTAPPASTTTKQAGSELSTPGVTPLDMQQADGSWKCIPDVDVAAMTDITGTWRLTIPANIEVTKPLHMLSGQKLEKLSLTGEIKLNDADTWTSPAEGKYRTGQVPTNNMFISDTIYAGEAIVRIGLPPVNSWKPLGMKDYNPLTAEGSVDGITFSINCHKGEVGFASGSYTTVFRIKNP
jgi:hypothetical protein